MSGHIAFEAFIVDDLVSYSCNVSRHCKISVEEVLGAVVHSAVQSVNANFDLNQTPIIAGSCIQVYPPINEIAAEKLSAIDPMTENITVLVRHADDRQKSLIGDRINSWKESEIALGSLQAKVEALAKGFGEIQAEVENLKKKGNVQQGEIEAGKREIRDLTKHNERLEKRVDELAKGNEELEGRVQSLKVVVARQVARSNDDLESIKKLTLALTPLHLRVLLDLARKKVLELLRCDSWEDIRGDQTVAQLHHALNNHPALTGIPYPPTSLGLDFLCSFNNVRRGGNAAAHTATKEEVKDAVQRKPLDGKERMSLEALYAFTYDEEL